MPSKWFAKGGAGLSRITKVFTALTSWDVETLFERKRPPPTPRSVYVNEPLPADLAFDAKGRPKPTWVFPSNQVLTSKYTVYNFIFKNLLEQFRRVANIFFLVLVILQFLPEFHTVSPGIAMLPLLVVLAITALKDGYEDLKRHQSDRYVNRQLKASVLSGGGWKNPNMMEQKGKTLTHIFRGMFDWHGRRSKAAARGMLRRKEHEKDHEKANGAATTADLEAADLALQHPGNEPTPAAAAGQPPVEPASHPATAPGGGDARNPTLLYEQQHHASRPGHALSPSPSRRLSWQVQQQQRRQPQHAPRPSMATRPSGDWSSEWDSDEDEAAADSDAHAPQRHQGGGGGGGEKKKAKRPRWKRKAWEDLAVGDFVRLKANEAIPADIVICSTSEEEDVCYIETKNLDGETNLKSRHAVPELTHLRTPQDCARASLRVDVEEPSTNMFRLNGAVVLSDRVGPDGKPLRCPVTLNTVLLRGCLLRNTDWVIGIVLYTGIDTKIVANSGGTPSKRSKVERQMNPMVFINLAILACICIACAVADSHFEKFYNARNSYWTVRDVLSSDNPSINGLVTFGNALITFQNIVPISLYISIEAVRTCQAYFIFDDYDIYYEKTKRRTTARSWNLSDDLGQIEYIFSDKTGTLTQNAMVFRQCCVGGKTYAGDADRKLSDTLDSATGAEKTASLESKDVDLSPGSSSRPPTASNVPGRKKVKLPPEVLAPFRDRNVQRDLEDPTSAQATALTAFFTCLALCHTVVVTEDEEGAIEYRAQSPDEAALVQASADVGFVFCGKDRDRLKLQTPYSTELEEYELLNTLEFSSARKRMSVIVRRIDVDDRSPSPRSGGKGKVVVLCKGADSVIFERLAPGQEEVRDQTDLALEEFANQGLRTLCLASKEIDERDYDEWAHRFHEANVALEGREDKMEKLADELERGFRLLGATAIEDRLQDGVPETIADLKRAGINIWVATGDKLETAIAIGYSTNLLSKDMNLIVVRGGEYGQRNSAYDQLRAAIERFFDADAILGSLEHHPPDMERPPSRRSSTWRRSTQMQRRASSMGESIVGANNGQRPGGYALVIDGAALTHALEEEFTKELLLEISTKCEAVICCRVSPLQKALIVKLIKDGLNVMTLAIGDGANDVSMIQAAHVGVGIAGEEGLQAVNASDYAIAQFRFLKRLLLVHGHWSYYRNGTMIVNFFYKEMINIGYLWWFQLYCTLSTTQYTDYVYLLFWNAFWTVAAVIGIGIFDRNASDRLLMQVPELYKLSKKGNYFGLKPFLIYMLDGLYQATILYFFISYAYNTTTARKDGLDIQLYEFSTVVAIVSVWIANFFNGLNTHAWTWWIVFAVFLGPVLISCFAPIYAAFKPSTFFTYSYGNNYYLYRSAYFYFSFPIAIVLSLLPRYICKFLRLQFFATDLDILSWVEKKDPNHDYINDPAMPTLRAVKAYYGQRPMAANADGGDASLEPVGSGEPLRQHRSSPSIPMHPLHQVRSTASARSSVHDMSTGRTSVHRGYSFSQEDDAFGRSSRRHDGGGTQRKKRTFKLPGSLRRGLFRKKSPLEVQSEVAEDEEERRGEEERGDGTR